MSYQNSRLKTGFGQVSNDVIRNPEYNLNEKAVYSYLSTYASAAYNDMTVSVNRMASECNITQSTITRILRKLQKAGVIMRVHMGKGNTWKTILLK